MSYYQDIIFKHARNPIGVGELPPPAFSASEHNSLCGDFIRVFVGRGQADRLACAFEAKGCALCRASASIMVQEITGRTSHDAAQFLAILTEQLETFSELHAPPWSEDVAALSDMRRYPSRLSCVLLPWKALGGALAALTQAEA